MNMRAFRSKLIATVILASLCSMPATAADDDDMPVVEVTVVKVYGSTSEYLEKFGAIIKVVKKHEPRAEVRVYQAAFAGTMYGQIHIQTRYPSFAALAAANPKIVADPEHDRAVEELAAVKREILSHYMLRDKTPE
jgi:ABC-type glycerol-3-phosphate transport system substrate-binding protein